ncbi:hypothetical protein OAV46_03955 [Euryarchaeota archaeon]|nr:hypothetical protein [Euryarchaeota archaeon]
MKKEERRKTMVRERLPELNDEHERYAKMDENKYYIQRNMEREEGEYWFDSDTGLTIQKVDKNTLRVIAVFDDPSPYLYLAMLSLTCIELGISIQMEPYTIIRPYIRREETVASDGSTGAGVA